VLDRAPHPGLELAASLLTATRAGEPAAVQTAAAELVALPVRERGELPWSPGWLDALARWAADGAEGAPPTRSLSNDRMTAVWPRRPLADLALSAPRWTAFTAWLRQHLARLPGPDTRGLAALEAWRASVDDHAWLDALPAPAARADRTWEELTVEESR